MQSVIYADVLFFINTVITFLILLTTADILRINSSKCRFLSGSFAGGIFAFIIFAPPMNIFLVFLIRILISVLIVLITFGINNVRRLLKCFTGFFLISFLYAGVVYFVSSFLGFSGVYLNNGFTYFDLSAVSLIAVTVILFICICFINRKILSRKKEDMFFDVRICRGGRTASVCALYDTGNNVKDIYSGRPVIIISITGVDRLMNKNELNLLEDFINNRTYCELPEGMRLLPVKTIDTEKLLPVFQADNAVISNDENRFYVEKILIAVTSDTFGENKYNALINDSVLGKVF